MDLRMLSYFLVMNSVGGSIAYLIWKLVCLIGGRRTLRYNYSLLIITLPFWVLPLAELPAILDRNAGVPGFWDSLWYSFSPLMQRVIPAVLVIWLILDLLICSVKLIAYLRYILSLRTNVPAEPWEKELLASVCAELGLKASVEIVRNEDYRSAFLYHRRGDVIVLPGRTYPPEHLRQVISHELIHAKKHDLMVRRIALVIFLINILNPIAHVMYRSVIFWSEVDCDIRVCDLCGSVKEYCRFLFTDLEIGGIRRVWRPVSYGDDAGEIRRRLKLLVNYHPAKQLSRLAGTVLGIVLVLALTANVVEAGEYECRVRKAVSGVGWAMTQEELDSIASAGEYLEPLDWEGREILDLGGDIMAFGAGWTGYWTLDRYQIGYKSLGNLIVGAQVGVMVEVPAGTRVGITHGSSMRYVVAPSTGLLQHSFQIYEAGEYRFFIDNVSNSVITVHVSLFY